MHSDLQKMEKSTHWVCHSHGYLQRKRVLRLKANWLELSTCTLRRLIRLNLSGTDSRYLILQVMAKFHLQGAQFSRPIFHAETQKRQMKNPT